MYTLLFICHRYSGLFITAKEKSPLKIDEGDPFNMMKRAVIP